MLKNKILVGSCLAALFLTTNVSPVQALELDEDTRTVTLDGKGNSVVLTPEQFHQMQNLLPELPFYSDINNGSYYQRPFQH